MWYGVQNISKYDINIKVQPLIVAVINSFWGDTLYKNLLQQKELEGYLWATVLLGGGSELKSMTSLS